MKLIAVFTMILALSSPAFSSTDGLTIDLWTRGAGDYTGPKDPPKVNHQTMNIKGLKLETILIEDIQYGKTHKYQGVLLRTFLSVYKPIPTTIDMIILHFRNGMLIPLRIQNIAETNGILIATELFHDKKFTTKFPTSVRRLKGEKDQRPIIFQGNKLVVKKSWALDHSKQNPNRFTPWRYVDSLTGIEFVDSVHYFNQFRDVAAKSSEMGLSLYQKRCQFCHGVMRIGAKFGPDFMLPEPISKKFTASSLIKHVSKNPSHSKKKYLAMPKQVSAKPEEIGAIWLWVKMLQDKKVNPYSPRK